MITTKLVSVSSINNAFESKTSPNASSIRNNANLDQERFYLSKFYNFSLAAEGSRFGNGEKLMPGLESRIIQHTERNN